MIALMLEQILNFRDLPIHIRLIHLISMGLMHGLVGALLVQVFTPYNPIYGFIFGVLPDIDYVFHYAAIFAGDHAGIMYHRGLTHTFAFLIGVVIFLWLAGAPESIVHSAVLGIGSHLLIDTASGWGVMWFWPISDVWIEFPLSLNAPEKSIAMVGISALLLYLTIDKDRHYREEGIQQ